MQEIPFTVMSPKECFANRHNRFVRMQNVRGYTLWICTGTYSQTFNLVPEGVQGRNYEVVVELMPPLSASQLAEFENVPFGGPDEFEVWLDSRGGKLRKSPRLSQPTLGALEPSRPLSEWEERACAVLEATIEKFILEFIDSPYLHRKESSLFCQLYSELASAPMLSEKHCLKAPGIMSQPLHKEWPRLRLPERQKRGRGDLSVLSPETLRSLSLKDYCEGKARPSLVIEMGLNEDRGHLQEDLEKLSCSGGSRCYLIHLIRDRGKDKGGNFDEVERLLLTPPSQNIKTAYARKEGNRFVFKLSTDSELKTKQLPLHTWDSGIALT